MAAPVRVVKVGGSLLDLADLADRLRQWLSRQSPAHYLLVAGGGTLVDSVRQWHAAGPINESEAHWMCVDLLTTTAQLLHDRLPEIPMIDQKPLLRARVAAPEATIFAPGRWLREGEPQLPGTSLPSTWEVSSDSIAGRLATALGADELVLMKSKLPETRNDQTIEALEAAGLVDPMFLRLERELPAVRIVNLRANSHPEVLIRTLGSTC